MRNSGPFGGIPSMNYMPPTPSNTFAYTLEHAVLDGILTVYRDGRRANGKGCLYISSKAATALPSDVQASLFSEAVLASMSKSVKFGSPIGGKLKEAGGKFIWQLDNYGETQSFAGLPLTGVLTVLMPSER